MGGGVSVKFDLSKLRAFSRRMPAVAREAVLKQMILFLRSFEATMVRRRMSGRPGLNRRTGSLARGWKVVRVGEAAVMLVCTVPYARIHEYGGVITPKRSRYLWIPGRELLTGAGVFRGWSQVNWANVFIRQGKRNKVALEDLGGRTRLVATLASSVTIPPRLGLRATFRDYRPDLERRLRVGIVAAIAQSARGG